MPAKSKAQRKMMAIALHAPEKLHARNRAAASMSKTDLEHFASTKETNLPARSKLRNSVKKHKRT